MDFGGDPATRVPSVLAPLVLHTVRQHRLEALLLNEPLVLAVSGGPDSLALLHLLCELRNRPAREFLTVAHLDHGIRGEEARADAQFVEAEAKRQGLQFVTERSDVPALAEAGGLSLEEAARRARYSFLAKVARERSAAVATGHTADDQVETVLMNMLRGTGTSGLAGMKVLSDVPVVPPAGVYVPLFRPLLGVWRSHITAYCQERGLKPREDASNADPAYTRNRVRSLLIPLMEREFNPAARGGVYRLSEIAADEDELLERLTDAAWDKCIAEVTPRRIVFKQLYFQALPRGLRRRLVRRAFGQLVGTLEGFGFHDVEAVCDTLAGGPNTPVAVDLTRRLRASRCRDGAVLERTGPVPAIERDAALGALPWPLVAPGTERALRPDQQLNLASRWQLACVSVEAESAAKPGELTAIFDLAAVENLGQLVVRAWHEGDYILPLGMKGKKKLHDLFVDAKIPKEFRRRIAVVALRGPAGEVLWVPGPGGRRSSRALVGPETKPVFQLQFTKTPAEGDH